MKCYLLIILLGLSCKNPDRKPVPKKITTQTITSQYSSSRECHYQQRTEKSKRLHHQHQQNPSFQTERAFTGFIADSLLPCWYGTKWDFNGVTEKPGEGSIACGYFVTTVLRDAGIQLNRVQLAQDASEEMIQKLCERKSLARFSNKPYTLFISEMLIKPDGLYIVGLDFHTGFLHKKEKEIYFIHASYANPKVVVRENAAFSSILASSKYKVTGKINLQL